MLDANNIKKIMPCSYKACKFLEVAIAMIFSNISEMIIIAAV
jgi:hypothetical protein